MKTYLITGGAGFIGSNFILYMLDKYKDIQIINIDKLTYAGNLDNLEKVRDNNNYVFVKGDISDIKLIDEIFRKYSIDYVVNFAAETHVDRSIRNPQVFINTNILGTVNLLNSAKKYWKDQEFIYKKFLQISTDEVYGSLDKEGGYFTEKCKLNPRSPYSASKASADMLVQSYYTTYGFPINITRCTNNYGAYQFPEKLIPLGINNCINRKKIPIYGSGTNIRDWIYVEDHCKAIDLVLEKGKIGEVYNIGSKNEKQNIEIVKLIIQIVNKYTNRNEKDDLIMHVKDRLGHDKRYAVDFSKIEKQLNWKPITNFEEGIEKTIRWYLDNGEWMKNITGKEYEIYYKEMYGNI